MKSNNSRTPCAAKKELSVALMPMEFVSLDNFHRCTMRPGEALAVFVHDLKKLLKQAMPGLDAPGREQLLLHQFLAGIPEYVSRQLRATDEIKTLGIAVTRARLLMTIDDHGQAAAVTEGPTEVQLLREQVALLAEHVSTLSTSRPVASGQQRPIGIDRGASVAIVSDTFSVSVPTVTEALILATASRVAKLDTSLKSAVRETT